MKILKKAGGVLLLIIGIFFFVSALKMIFVDNPKTKAALKDAVYVDAADTINPENDGKTVIVCGTFELTEPAHDDDMAFWNGIHLSAACRYQVKGKLEIMHFRRILLMILC